MTDHQPILTPLTEIEKADLLNSIPRHLPQHMLLRRVLRENDELREKVKWFEVYHNLVKEVPHGRADF